MKHPIRIFMLAAGIFIGLFLFVSIVSAVHVAALSPSLAETGITIQSPQERNNNRVQMVGIHQPSAVHQEYVRQPHALATVETWNGRYASAIRANDKQFVNKPLAANGASLALAINYAHEWVAGYITPSASVAVTLTDGMGAVKATAVVVPDGDGNFFTNCDDWSTAPDCPNIEVGDGAAASAGGLMQTIDPIGSIDGDLDAVENTVAGVLNAPWFTGTLNVRCEVWVEMGPSGIDTTAVANGGSFLCDFDDVGWDLEPGQDVAIMYFEPDGDQIINVLGFPWTRVNYDHDWVGANYEVGHVFWITVTDSANVVKATAVISSWPGGGWGGDGFDTQWWHWSPQQPDIMPGDTVEFVADDGYSNTMEVGAINGSLDIVADAISGTLDVPWFTDTLNMECHPWGAWNAGLFSVTVKNTMAAPDGSTTWNCSWAGEWDIVPGQDVAAMYVEPDTDRVIAVYRDPAPHLLVNKWADGAPAEDGNYLFHLEYWNDGDAPAEDVVITDTMEGFRYLVDTGPFSVMTGTVPGGEYAAWNLGTVPANSYYQFDVFAEVISMTSDMVTNTMQITTSNPYNQSEPWNLWAQWTGQVEANDTHLNVGKYAWTGDPAPGYDFVFAVNVCNNGNTASSQVVVTDTLHPSMTLQSWWGQNPGWFELTSSADQLVVAYPAMPGYWCNEVYVQVNLDAAAWPGMYITNTAVITAANDLENDDNFAFWEGNVNEPHTNLHLDKNFNWGQLVPGGQIAYGLNVGNEGNVPITTTYYVTDYLPVSTTYNSAWFYDQYGPHPMTPTLVADDYVVWEFNGLANGFWENWELIVDIEAEAAPGMVLTNTAVVSPQPDEDRYDDNSDSWIEMLYPSGPNLRIIKEGWWNWEGQQSYWLRLDNIGTEIIYDPIITDMLPMSTTFNGEWWHGFWEDVNFVDDSGNGRLIWTLTKLEPGWSTGIGFNVDVDGNIVGQGGLLFTNTAWIDAPGLLAGEVNPADNTDTIVMPTGPDIYIEKWLSGGSPEPGQIVTFTVEFGNSNIWPWDSGPETTITDTLPAGMIFITATAPWNPNDHWTPTMPSSDMLVWDWGEVWNNSWWQFDIIVQITDTMTSGQVLVNEIEMYSDNPAEVEPDYANNRAVAEVTVLAPLFAINKVYDSNEVAGMPVTYTLTISNDGNLSGTGILITDSLPSNVTWLSGGSYDSGTDVVSWMLPALADGQTAAVSFVGELACSGSAVNEDYRVAGSNEGVGSGIGPTVAFTIQAPTIVASFTQSAMNVAPGTAVDFNSSSTTNGSSFVSWEWDFGDGSMGSGASVSHVFEAEGTYDVTLTVTDGCGYTDTIMLTDAVVVESAMTFIYLPFIIKTP